MALRLLLKKHYFKVDEANNGESAVQMVRKKDQDKSCSCYYKLIIMDCNMPKMNGYEACNQLKNEYVQGKLLNPNFIIAYSADISQENKDRCKKFQFDDYFCKPIQIESLQALLKSVF